ncbi:MAG: IclR family transcriptional regulator [Acidobacteria bacterium]|nr:IclR family transcriptional regulator [Acidobacteriota bacterium]
MLEAMAESSAPKATAVERAMAMLEYLDGSRRGLNISEISRKLGIPKSSAHVIVVTLERLGYVQKREDSLHYTLGLKAYGLGQGMLRGLSIAELAMPHMRALAEQWRRPVHLAVPDGDQGVYIQKAEAPGLIQFDTYVGRRMDLHCTGVGKVLLAWGPPDILARLTAKPTYIRYTKNTITNPKALQKEVAAVRKLGWAVDDEEEELGVRCVAVPVFSAPGRFVAGLSVTGTTGQIPLDEVEVVARRLRQAALAMFAPVAELGAEGGEA